MANDSRQSSDRLATLKAAYGGVCAICGEAPQGWNRALHINFNQATGEVRGVLCNHCNLLMAHARDSEEVLIKAITYLRGSNGA